MSGNAIGILVRHVLLTSRSGLAACAAEHCDWEDKFYPIKDWHPALVPTHIQVAHAEHQLEMLEAIGFGDTRQASATLTLIAHEIGLMTHGGLANYGEGLTFYSPIYPVPRGIGRIRELLKQVTG